MKLKLFLGVLLLQFSVTATAQDDDLWNYKTKDSEKLFVFTKAEYAPQFPGGEEALISFIDSSLNKQLVYNSYKEIKKKQKVTAEICCIVKKDGKAIEPTVKGDSITDALRDEITRVLSISPKWTAATQNKYDVACYKCFVYKLTIPAHEN